MKIISLRTMYKLLRFNGAHRVSPSAQEELRDHLESISTEITHKAIQYMKHRKKKIVAGEDVKLAIKYYRR